MAPKDVELSFSVSLNGSEFLSMLFSHFAAQKEQNYDTSFDVCPEWKGTFSIMDETLSNKMGNLSVRLAPANSFVPKRECFSVDEETSHGHGSVFTNNASSGPTLNYQLAPPEHTPVPLTQLNFPPLTDALGNGIHYNLMGIGPSCEKDTFLDLPTASEDGEVVPFESTSLYDNELREDNNEFYVDSASMPCNPSSEEQECDFITHEEDPDYDPESGLLRSNQNDAVDDRHYPFPLHKCNLCPYQTPKLYLLRQHLSRHSNRSGRRHVHCTMCLYCCMQKRSLKKHYQDMHKLDNEMIETLLCKTYRAPCHLNNQSAVRKKQQHHSHQRPPMNFSENPIMDVVNSIQKSSPKVSNSPPASRKCEET